MAKFVSKPLEALLVTRKARICNCSMCQRSYEEVLNGFFTMLENLLDTFGIKDMPERFFNLDETGLSLDPKKKCAFYHKNAQMIFPTEGKTMYTMLFCGNAAGT